MSLMSSATTLTPLGDALARLLAGLAPVPPEIVPVGEAVGWVAAETLRAAMALPKRSVALRSGIAVASADLVGASPYTPAMMASPPPRLFLGDDLPAGTDAVLPADAVTVSGPVHEIGQAAYPGEGAALAGSDLAQDALLVARGATITAEIALALALAGMPTVAVRRPRIAVTGDTAGAAAAWLGARLSAAGCAVVTGPPVDLTLHLAADPAGVAVDLSGIAVRPGGDMALSGDASGRKLVLAPRFDAVVTGFHALVLPFVAAATARRQHRITRPLTRKIVSQVGLADIALLRHTGDAFEPLGIGRVTLSALLAADAVAILDPASEGAAAGAPLAAILVTEPFEPL
jgi:molybdopterin molybdotransferase